MPKNGVEALENILRNRMGLLAALVLYSGFGLASFTGISED